MVAQSPARGSTESTKWWHAAHRKEAQSPPRGGTKSTAWWHKAHQVVAQSPPRGGTKPTAWWHKAHQVVAQSPPRGGTKPTKWWYKAHQVVAPSCEARACSARGAASGATKSETAGKKHSAWRGPWVRGLSSARRRPPANRRGVRLPRKAYIVRSRYTYTYTPPLPPSLPPSLPSSLPPSLPPSPPPLPPSLPPSPPLSPPPSLPSSLPPSLPPPSQPPPAVPAPPRLVPSNLQTIIGCANNARGIVATRTVLSQLFLPRSENWRPAVRIFTRTPGSAHCCIWLAPTPRVDVPPALPLRSYTTGCHVGSETWALWGLHPSHPHDPRHRAPRTRCSVLFRGVDSPFLDVTKRLRPGNMRPSHSPSTHTQPRFRRNTTL